MRLRQHSELANLSSSAEPPSVHEAQCQSSMEDLGKVKAVSGILRKLAQNARQELNDNIPESVVMTPCVEEIIRALSIRYAHAGFQSGADRDDGVKKLVQILAGITEDREGV